MVYLSIALSFTALAFACEYSPDVHVEKGSTKDSLIFHVYEPRDSMAPSAELRELLVFRCPFTSSDTGAIWDLTRVTGPRKNQQLFIVYGRTPDVFWRVHRSP